MDLILGSGKGPEVPGDETGTKGEVEGTPGETGTKGQKGTYGSRSVRPRRDRPRRRTL